MKEHKIAGFLIVLVIFISVAASAQVADVYFPVDIGDKWVYQHTFSDTVTETAVDTQRIDGKLYVQLTPFRYDPSGLFRVMNDRVYRFLGETEGLWYDFSANIGDTWRVKDRLEGEWTAWLISKTDTVVTPGGIFTNCYHFGFFGQPDNDWEEWFAPGIGIVQRDLHGFAFARWMLIDSMTPTAIHSVTPPEPFASMMLYQNYPNPFNPVTIIPYTLPASREVTLKVYDLQGREVLTLVRERQAAGGYRVELDARRLASGVYFYELVAGNFRRVRRMILIK